MNKYKVAVRTAIEVTVWVDADDEHEAAQIAHDWVASNASVETWAAHHELNRAFDDDPVSFAQCTDFEMQLEPEDYDVVDLGEA